MLKLGKPVRQEEAHACNTVRFRGQFALSCNGKVGCSRIEPLTQVQSQQFQSGERKLRLYNHDAVLVKRLLPLS